MARRYGDELKRRVKAAHGKLVERHPKVSRLGERGVWAVTEKGRRRAGNARS